MSKRYKLALHVFRRDLRKADNTGLMEALRLSEQVIPCFIFDTRQVEHNAYKSAPAIQFMVRSLTELHEALQKEDAQLYCFHGKAEEVIEKLLKQLPIEAVFFNRDYTPFSLKRDRAIAKACDKQNVACHCCADALLTEPEEIAKKDGGPYTIFTPFYKSAKTVPVRKPSQNHFRNYYNKKISDTVPIMKGLVEKKATLMLEGGRKEGLKLLRHALTLKNYAKTRNDLGVAGTTYLSAHNKFGTISIREFYHAVKDAFGKENQLLTELYWRDFFTHIGYHFPHVFSGAFHKKYDELSWTNDQQNFKKWCDGKTGFPIVDAGMRQLNATGYMHNRVRMIVASFLVKDLHIHWQKGEKYFARHLLDYDPSINNGNWQWAASTGCDAQPYFRIFNPWLQQKRYDPECIYVKEWVPELKEYPAKKILNHEHDRDGYILPIVDHKSEAIKAKKFFKKIS